MIDKVGAWGWYILTNKKSGSEFGQYLQKVVKYGQLKGHGLINTYGEQMVVQAYLWSNSLARVLRLTPVLLWKCF